MTDTKRVPTEVWFSYRAKGSDTLHRVKLPGHIANRWARKLTTSKAYVLDIVTPVAPKNKLLRVRMNNRVEHLVIEGDYAPVVKKRATVEAKIHLQVAQSNNWRRSKESEAQEQYEQELIARRISKTGKITTQRMSFHVGRLEQDVVILCPVTGIIGKLEMPYCPVALQYEHPLAKAGNVLNLLRYHFSLAGQHDEVLFLAANSRLKLDRQTLAGCLLSLLKAKGLLEDTGESSSTERNMVLQNAGFEVLAEFLKETVRTWDNAQVWRRIPKLRVDWSVHSKGTDTNIAGTLQAMLKVIKTALDPQQLTQEEQSKILSAQRTREEQKSRYNSVKIYSASAVETRKIKEAKSEARDMFETLKPTMPIATRALVFRVIKDLMILPAKSKQEAASMLRVCFIGKHHAVLANKLAVLIENAENTAIFDEMSTISIDRDIAAKRPTKSIAEILEAKKAKAENRVTQQQERIADDNAGDHNV